MATEAGLSAGAHSGSPPGEARAEPRATPEFGSAGAAQHLLLTGSAPEVLARIVPGDPLGLRARIGARLLERALLLDTESVLVSAQALCALHAPTWRGQPDLCAWLEGRIEEALAECLAECVAESLTEVSAEPAPGRARAARALEPFARPLALDPNALAAACAHFNLLSLERREAFVTLVLEARPPERLARARKLSLSELGRRARAGLELFRRN